MAELIAVVYPEGQDGQSALQRAVAEHGLTMLEAGFAHQIGSTLGAGGTLALFVADDAASARGVLERHGGTVFVTSLEGVATGALALGGNNPQMRGEERRESGGESTEESGQ